MKKILSTSLILSLFVFALSCQKKAGAEKIAGDADGNYWPDQRYCNIDSIRISNSNKYYKFSYDAQGDPVSIITNGTSTGDPNHFFYYDAGKRMIRYIRLYDDGVSFENYKKYVYGANNRVIRDTSFSFGTVVNGQPTNYYTYNVTTYTYDSLWRISSTYTEYVEYPGQGFTINYPYDANGNLIVDGVTYDNRNNLHNTNNWWRLIDREYSKNNPYTATSYTGYWLPRDIFSGLSSNFRYFLDISLEPHAVIKYVCGN